MSHPAPLILTLALDERSFAFFDGQRRRFFPPERNFIPAHLTLFHRLPGEHVGTIRDTLDGLCFAQRRFPLAVTNLRSLGRGVAYSLHSDDLARLHGELARLWVRWLTPQDRQKHQPHVTIQNNVEPPMARELLARLSSTFAPFEATGIGLDLWWYRGGPWEKACHFPFAA